MDRIDYNAIETGDLVVFSVGVGARSPAHPLRVSGAQRVIADTTAAREHGSGVSGLIPGSGTDARTHVASIASHVGVAVRTDDLFERAADAPPAALGSPVLIFEQTSSSRFNDNVADIWGKRHLACAQLRPLQVVAAAALARGASTYIVKAPRACGSADAQGTVVRDASWRDALAAFVALRLGARYESPAMLILLAFGLEKLVQKTVRIRALREHIVHWGETCSEMAWNFGCSSVFPLAMPEREAASLISAQSILPAGVVGHPASPWSRGRVAVLSSPRWRPADAGLASVSMNLRLSALGTHTMPPPESPHPISPWTLETSPPANAGIGSLCSPPSESPPTFVVVSPSPRTEPSLCVESSLPSDATCTPPGSEPTSVAPSESSTDAAPPSLPPRDAPAASTPTDAAPGAHTGAAPALDLSALIAKLDDVVKLSEQ